MSNIHIATAIIYVFGAQPLALNHRTQYILDIIYVPLMRIWRTSIINLIIPIYCHAIAMYPSAHRHCLRQ